MPPSGWADQAVALLRAQETMEPGTPLWRFPLPDTWPVELFLKDESARPTGSLKYGFARSLFIDAIARRRIRENTPLVEATSGNMAVAEAHFAQLLGLSFTAVVPYKAGRAKLARIEERGGKCYPVDPPLAVYERAEKLAAEIDGCYLDCLTTIGDVVDSQVRDTSRGLAAEILRGLAEQGRPEPTWIVLGVGTGASSRAVGRHLRYRGCPTRVAVVDPENSAYFPGWATDCPDYATGMPSRIEGIGRPRIEPAFDASVVDLVIPIPDAASIAAMRFVNAVTGLSVGPSTGAGLWGALHLLHRMREAGTPGSVVTVVGDSGAPYASTYYDNDWVAGRGLDLSAPTAKLERFACTGAWDDAAAT
jgi:cysteine synthase A